jgi:hypothetical protein
MDPASRKCIAPDVNLQHTDPADGTQATVQPFSADPFGRTLTGRPTLGPLIGEQHQAERPALAFLPAHVRRP